MKPTVWTKRELMRVLDLYFQCRGGRPEIPQVIQLANELGRQPSTIWVRYDRVSALMETQQKRPTMLAPIRGRGLTEVRFKPTLAELAAIKHHPCMVLADRPGNQIRRAGLRFGLSTEDVEKVFGPALLSKVEPPLPYPQVTQEGLVTLLRSAAASQPGAAYPPGFMARVAFLIVYAVNEGLISMPTPVEEAAIVDPANLAAATITADKLVGGEADLRPKRLYLAKARAVELKVGDKLYSDLGFHQHTVTELYEHNVRRPGAVIKNERTQERTAFNEGLNEFLEPLNVDRPPVKAVMLERRVVDYINATAPAPLRRSLEISLQENDDGE